MWIQLLTALLEARCAGSVRSEPPSTLARLAERPCTLRQWEGQKPDAACFTPGSEYTAARCCDPKSGAGGDPSCWGAGYSFARCCVASALLRGHAATHLPLLLSKSPGETAAPSAWPALGSWTVDSLRSVAGNATVPVLREPLTTSRRPSAPAPPHPYRKTPA